MKIIVFMARIDGVDPRPCESKQGTICFHPSLSLSVAPPPCPVITGVHLAHICGQCALFREALKPFEMCVFQLECACTCLPALSCPDPTDPLSIAAHPCLLTMPHHLINLTILNILTFLQCITIDPCQLLRI